MSFTAAGLGRAGSLLSPPSMIPRTGITLANPSIYQPKRSFFRTSLALFARKGGPDEEMLRAMEIRKRAREKERIALKRERAMQQGSMEEFEEEKEEGTTEDLKRFKGLTAYFMNVILSRDKRRELRKLPTCPTVPDSVKEKIYQLHKLSPQTFSVPELALRFGYQQGRILAWLKLKEEEKKLEKQGNLLPPDLVQLVELTMEAPERRDDRVKLEDKYPTGRVKLDFIDDEVDEILFEKKIQEGGRKRKIKSKVLPARPPPDFEQLHPQHPMTTNLQKIDKPLYIIDTTSKKRGRVTEENRLILVREDTIGRNANWAERRRLLMKFFPRDRNLFKEKSVTDPALEKNPIGVGEWDWDNYPGGQHPEEQTQESINRFVPAWTQAMKMASEDPREFVDNVEREIHEVEKMTVSLMPKLWDPETDTGAGTPKGRRHTEPRDSARGVLGILKE